MDIQKNSRQVPKTIDICSNKKYYDILYAYLQQVSVLNEMTGERLFYKKDINFSKLGEKFGLTRQTISTKFKNLKELGLIVEIDKNTYSLIKLNKDYASLIPYNTLKLLTDTLSENCISAYVYLLNEYYRQGCKPYQFTLDNIKAHIGICTTTRSNNDIITNILYVLGKIGLIKYSLSTFQQENDSFENVKTIYRLDWLTNVIE